MHGWHHLTKKKFVMFDQSNAIPSSGEDMLNLVVQAGGRTSVVSTY